MSQRAGLSCMHGSELHQSDIPTTRIHNNYLQAYPLMTVHCFTPATEEYLEHKPAHNLVSD